MLVPTTKGIGSEVEVEVLRLGEAAGCLGEAAGLTALVYCSDGGAGYVGCGNLCPEGGTSFTDGTDGYLGAEEYGVGE